MNMPALRILAVFLLILGMVGSVPAAELPPFYIITAEAGPGGYIVPSGDWPVNPGSDQIFYFIPDDGFEVRSVIVDTKDLGARKNYVFRNVDRNHTISATIHPADRISRNGRLIRSMKPKSIVLFRAILLHPWNSEYSF